MQSYRDRLILFTVAVVLLLGGLSPIVAFLNLWRGEQQIERQDYAAAFKQYRKAALLTPKDRDVSSVSRCASCRPDR